MAHRAQASPSVPPRQPAQHDPKHTAIGGIGRAVGLGLFTGAADDDPSAIGTYATAGAKIGPAFLWTAPVTFPMMVAVVYLSAKLGQVTGKGLFGPFTITTRGGFSRLRSSESSSATP